MRYPDRSPLSAPTKKKSGVILREILDELDIQGNERMSTTASINGVCSYASQQTPAPRTPEVMLAIMWQRFDLRPLLAAVLQHPRFEEFLSKKATELSSKTPTMEPR